MKQGKEDTSQPSGATWSGLGVSVRISWVMVGTNQGLDLLDPHSFLLISTSVVAIAATACGYVVHIGGLGMGFG